MPMTFRGILGFVFTATLTVVVGTFVYNKFVAPMIAQVRKAA